MKYWSQIFNRSSSRRHIEYIAVDAQFTILDTSEGAQNLSDSPEDVVKGKDARVAFPELIGLEDILNDILQGNQESFEMKGVARILEPNKPIYIDLYILEDKDAQSLFHQVIILLEEVTEQMVLEQTLVQALNEKNLLISSLSSYRIYVDKILASIADALLITTSAGIIKRVNRSAQNLFGYTEEALIGQPIFILIEDPNFLASILQHQSLLTDDFLEETELVCRTKSGKEIWVAFSCSVIQTDLEDLQNFIYRGRDITERKRSQIRMLTQHSITRIFSEIVTIEQAIPKILQVICENLNWDLGVVWTTNQYTYTDSSVGTNLNQSSLLYCVELWAKPCFAVSEFIHITHQVTVTPGVGLAGLIWATFSPQWIANLTDDIHLVPEENAFNAGLRAAFGFPISDGLEILGVIVFYSATVQAIDNDLLEMMASIGSQLGQFIKRKKAERELQESENRYRDLFENANDLIQSVGMNGDFLYVNQSWLRTLDYSKSEVEKLKIWHIIHPDYISQYSQVIYWVISRKQNLEFQTVLLDKSGEKIFVEGTMNCKFVNDKPVATRVILHDITQRLQAEEALRYQQEQTERLLLNILPAPIAEKLKKEQNIIAEHFEEATVLFADIVGFTELSMRISPTELVEVLNVIFSEFDQLTERHGLEKIKTIGDAYMVVGGIPTPRIDHAQAVAEMALDMQATIAQFNQETGNTFSLRIGINTGPVVAGVIGIKKFIYDLWGDTVNTASRMESHGLAGQIQVTPTTYQYLQEQYRFATRGAIYVKGKGEMLTYFLQGHQGS